MNNVISYKELKKAYIQAAKIVAKYGDKYLPIFKRLEREFKKRQDDIDTLNRAIKIASSDENKRLN